MRKLEKFVFKFICLCVLIGSFAWGIVMPQYETGYLAAYKDKYLLLHTENGKIKRIILMGDSNVAFGIDSERIEEAFGVQVINMGLHGGLGKVFCMDIARSGIREGDIVIVLPASFTYSKELPDGTLAWTMLENDITLWKEVNPRDYIALIKGFPSYFKRALNLWVNMNGNTQNPDGYQRDAFNSYGDIITTGNDNVMEQGYLPTSGCSVNKELLEYFNEYNQYVTERGAVMLLAGRPIIDSPDRPDDAEYEAEYAQVKDGLEFEMISDWEDYLYPMDYFYDTNFHLNDVGRAYRTEQLIKDIENWMKMGSSD